MIARALDYAARGWQVFTLSDGKVPYRNCGACAVHVTPQEKEECECLHCHGFYAATTDPRRIKEMFATRSGVCLAIRTGLASSLAVVDVDIRGWRADGTPAPTDLGFQTVSRLDAQGLLPGTLMQTTASGGIHLFYAHPGEYLMSGAGKFGPRVDAKADSAYVVVAPSVGARGRYVWTPDGRSDHPLTPLPDGLAALLRPAQSEPRPTGRTSGVVANHHRLKALLDFVLGAAEGERNDKLHWAATKVGEMVAATEVDQATAVAVLQDVAIVIGLSRGEAGDETRGTIASGLRKGLVHGRGVAA